jgi:hypothetical protein
MTKLDILIVAVLMAFCFTLGIAFCLSWQAAVDFNAKEKVRRTVAYPGGMETYDCPIPVDAAMTPYAPRGRK